jgi:transcriptional regulator, XRE family|nr:MAG TPA: helix-turn-helix domain protein [Caudoviricetes sp.]
MVRPNIGEKLKELRLKSRYTLDEVGKLIGVSKQTLYKYENNIVSNIPSDKIEALANLYRVSPALIMGWDEPTPEYYIDPAVNAKAEYARAQEGILLDAAKDLSDEDLDYVVDLVKRLRGK